jgi:2-dehydro-3-deoxyphosphogluconate aldolase/(4S)-4-hydroxy-2-oxoglutarate aldolase
LKRGKKANLQYIVDPLVASMSTPAKTLHPILQSLETLGIVPVVVIDDPGQARALGQALIDGGLPCAEITFRTAGARDAIAEISQAHPEMLLGAGTVLTVVQAQQALEAGARFIVAPGLNPSVVSFCREREVPMTPGIMTPTDIETALGLGLHVVKFFPAEAAGGLRFLKAVSAPYKSVRFVPTGGIDRSNFLQYLGFPATLAVGGSWMVKAAMIRERRFDLITEEVKMAVGEMIGLRIESGSTADPRVRATLEELGSIIPIARRPDGGEEPAGEGAEGEQVVCLSTHFLDRALGRLRSAGVRYSTAAGSPHRAVLDITPAGWTVELVQRSIDK